MAWPVCSIAASAFGYHRHDEDFGQTLGVWGVPGGPYLMLPLLGPSNGRDTAGRVGDYFINPLNHCCINQDERLGLFGVTAVSEREANIELLDDLRANSIDLYATIRTIYTQKRAADIRNGAPPTDQEGYEDIFKDEELRTMTSPPEAPATRRTAVARPRPGRAARAHSRPQRPSRSPAGVHPGAGRPDARGPGPGGDRRRRS